MKDETGKPLYQRWCSNRAFANFDLTCGNPKNLHDQGITEVYSNGKLVWLCGELVGDPPGVPTYKLRIRKN